MKRWLLAALLLMSTPLIWTHDTETTTTPSNGHSMISIDACMSTCSHTVDQVKTMCNERSSQTPTLTLSSDTCETDCSDELHSLRHELEATCDQNVTQAVSEERRSSEPLIAGLRAGLDQWKKDTEDAVRAARLWRNVAMGAGGCAVGTVVVVEALDRSALAGCVLGGLVGVAAGIFLP